MYPTILLIILIAAFLAALPVWPYSKTWGSLPSLGIGIVLAGMGMMMYMDKL